VSKADPCGFNNRCTSWQQVEFCYLYQSPL